jgi:hypothetical protein
LNGRMQKSQHSAKTKEKYFFFSWKKIIQILNHLLRTERVFVPKIQFAVGILENSKLCLRIYLRICLRMSFRICLIMY